MVLNSEKMFCANGSTVGVGSLGDGDVEDWEGGGGGGGWDCCGAGSSYSSMNSEPHLGHATSSFGFGLFIVTASLHA